MLNEDGVLIYTFADVCEEKEDFSFMLENGEQAGELENDKFGYSGIGVDRNIKILSESGCKCLYLEFDQYPEKHIFLIAKREIE